MLRIICCSLVLVACGTAAAKAGDCCDQCDRCGCQCACQKVCRLVPTTKKVPKVTYTCECEDFCVPGPSDHCVTCDECGKKKHVYTPTCAKVRTRTKLVKHETMEEVPTHKWVVETVCNGCAGKCSETPTGDASAMLPLSETSSRRMVTPQWPGVAEPAPALSAQASATEGSGLTAQLRRMLPGGFGQK